MENPIQRIETYAFVKGMQNAPEHALLVPLASKTSVDASSVLAAHQRHVCRRVKTRLERTMNDLFM